MSLLLKTPSLLKNQIYIDGKWTAADSGESFPVFNPANGELIASVPRAAKAETERAINAADSALHTWRKTSVKERSRLLKAWHGLLMAHQEDLAQIMTHEQGKPLAEARAEVAYGAAYIEWFAEEAKRIEGDWLPGFSEDRRMLVMKQAVGVVAAITPWNFPLAMMTRKVAPALAAGCTVVVKPASETPLTALAAMALAEEAGIPAGVINIITGRAGDIGTVLTQSPVVRKLSFTGSTEVGRRLYAECAPTLKKMSLELGGNAPFIVFDDADLEAAVAGAMASKFRNSGQTCVCSNRFFVQAGIYEAFTEKLAAAMQQLRVGPGWEAGVTQGPLINEAAVLQAEAMVAQAVSEGADLVVGGKRLANDRLFFAPTLIRHVRQDMAIASQELFSPIVTLIRFETEADAIAMANATEFGLASYFYSRDLNRVLRVSEALEYGMVGVNEGLISSEMAPFGGIKASGLGREGSRYGIDDYLEMKYICIGGVK